MWRLPKVGRGTTRGRQAESSPTFGRRHIDAEAENSPTSGRRHMDNEGDAYLANGAVIAFARAGDLAQAEAGLQRLRDEGSSASAAAYRALVEAIAKEGDLQRTEFWLEAQLSEGRDIHG